jgi:hypothetical protein
LAVPARAARKPSTRRARPTLKKAEPDTAAPLIRLRHKASGREVKVPTGFAWDLFLFAGIFGLPLFRRHLPYWGAFVLALWLLVILADALPLSAAITAQVQLVLAGAFFLLQLWLGVFGNRLMARTLLAHGWALDGANDSATKRIIAKWKLAS